MWSEADLNRRHTDFQYGKGGRQNSPILLGNAVLMDQAESHYRYITDKFCPSLDLGYF